MMLSTTSRQKQILSSIFCALWGCGEEEKEIANNSRGESDGVREKSLQEKLIGSWSDEASMVTFTDDQISVSFGGDELPYPSGNYEILKEGVGLLKTHNEKFFFSFEEDNIIEIGFDRIGGLKLTRKQ
jgi:hypothetical protein